MAHFYGTLKGNRGEASRLGSKASGIKACIASWEGAVTVVLWHDAETGVDMASVYLNKHHGAGTDQPLYYGPVGGGNTSQAS